MNPENLKVLAERAATVEGRPVERLDQVHARIRRARRRRQVGAVVTAVVAVVLALTVGVGLLAVTRPDRTPPATPAPRPTVAPRVIDEEGPSVRRLTYATGHKIHWGDRVIDVDGEVGNVTATDDGVVFTRDGPGESGNCNAPQSCFGALWFTDGSGIVRIGRASGSWVRGYQVQFSSAGSMVVWFEPDPDARSLNPAYGVGGEYVAYDTGQRREAGRFGSGRSAIVAVLDDDVYWLPDSRQCVDFYGECLRFKGHAMRFEASTGRQVPVSWSSYRAVRSDSARTLVSPQLEEIAEGTVVTPAHPQPKFNNGFGFRREGNRLIGDDGTIDVVVRLARTGAPLRLRVPADYTASDYFTITQWLDDDRVVLSASDADDLLVCRVPSGRCRLAVTRSSLDDFAGRG